MTSSLEASASWNREYAIGRYLNDPPVAFIEDIVSAARDGGLRRGIYIGCGNGRNYVPLVRAGLDLVGLDISEVALEQLAGRVPELRDRLVLGDLNCLPTSERYDLVIGIQVFQHGTRSVAHAHLRAALDRVRPGGLMAARVNAAETDVVVPHNVIERGDDGSFTVRYEAGPKAGLAIHFFTCSELSLLCAPDFEPVLPLRLQSTYRTPPATGQWSQWEGIWRRTGTARRIRDDLSLWQSDALSSS